MKTFSIEPIGVIRSEIKHREDAPLFYTEDAPNAFLEMIPACTDGLDRMQVGDEIIVIPGFIGLAGRCSRLTLEGTYLILLQEYFRLGHLIVRTPWGFIA